MYKEICIHVEVIVQLVRAGSFLPLCGFQRSNQMTRHGSKYYLLGHIAHMVQELLVAAADFLLILQKKPSKILLGWGERPVAKVLLL